MFKVCGVLALLVILAGCNKERLEEGAKAESKKTINVAGKREPAPPVGISDTMVLVEGRWMRAKDEGVTWQVRCHDGQCKPRLIK
jgi:hypothetical protein